LPTTQVAYVDEWLWKKWVNLFLQYLGIEERNGRFPQFSKG
jgi:hypothetical protein